MCGNQISTVSTPNSDFHTLVTTQLPSRRIALKNYPINSTHTIQLGNMNMSSIRQLSLQRCRINHESIEELSRIHFPVLTRLNLNDNEIGPIGCRALAGSELLARLTELSVNNNKVKDVGVKALAAADLSALQDISLNDNTITTDGVAALRGKLDSIECLSLGGNKLNDKSIAVISSLNPQSIYFLKLSRNEITDEGLRELLKNGKNLEVLLIDRNKINEGKGKYSSKDLEKSEGELLEVAEGEGEAARLAGQPVYLQDAGAHEGEEVLLVVAGEGGLRFGELQDRPLLFAQPEQAVLVEEQVLVPAHPAPLAQPPHLLAVGAHQINPALAVQHAEGEGHCLALPYLGDRHWPNPDHSLPIVRFAVQDEDIAVGGNDQFLVLIHHGSLHAVPQTVLQVDAVQQNPLLIVMAHLAALADDRQEAVGYLHVHEVHEAHPARNFLGTNLIPDGRRVQGGVRADVDLGRGVVLCGLDGEDEVLGVEVDYFDGIVVEHNGEELMAFIGVYFDDMPDLEIEVGADVLEGSVEDQYLALLQDDSQEVLLPAPALDHPQHPRLLRPPPLLALQLHPRPQYLRRLDVIEPLLLILTQ